MVVDTFASYNALLSISCICSKSWLCQKIPVLFFPGADTSILLIHDLLREHCVSDGCVAVQCWRLAWLRVLTNTVKLSEADRWKVWGALAMCCNQLQWGSLWELLLFLVLFFWWSFAVAHRVCLFSLWCLVKHCVRMQTSLDRSEGMLWCCVLLSQPLCKLWVYATSYNSWRETPDL